MAIAAGALALDSYLDIVGRRNQRVQEVKERMALAAQHAASRQYEFTSGARLLLGSLTRLGPEVDLCGGDFKDLAEGSEWLKAISVADMNGKLVCSSGPLGANVSVADRDYYKEAIRTRGFVLSDYVMGRVHRAPVILAAAPHINGQNEVDAVIILSVDVGWLNKVADSIGGGGVTKVLLIDHKGTVAAANERGRFMIGKSVSDFPLYRHLLGREGQVFAGTSGDDVPRLYTAARLEGSEARLIIGISEAEVLAPANAAARQDYLKNALFFFVLFGIAWLMADRLIVRPIRLLKNAATALADADYGHRIDTYSLPADFDELAETLNTTAELLERKEQLIAEQNRRLRTANRQLSELANLDELTGIANRRTLNERLKDVFHDGTAEPVALLILDLDKFKPVNDLMGHPVGDMVLKEAAARLNALVRRDELVARLGGDEFAMLVSCADGPERPLKIAQQVIECMSAPFPAAGGQVDIGASVGIAFAATDALNRSELLRAADLAMYAAKHNQRGSFCLFERAMGEEIQQRAVLETELRAAIRDGEIVPYFQPFVELKTGRIVGFEILARWNHASRGVLTPDRFIQIADEAGLTEMMTRHLVGVACRQARNWPKDLILSINLSPNQLGNPLLPTLIASTAIDCGMPPVRFEIEITEDALIKDFAGAQAVMQAFRSFGMTVALDDFGTGYSNMQNLHELRFDKIKIDRSFITELSASGSDRTLVAAIMAMTRNLDLPATAEGVEDAETARLLGEMGCIYAQGFHFGRPVPAQDVPAMLRADGARGQADIA